MSKKVKILFIICFILLGLFFLRGALYRLVVSYETVGTKPLIQLKNDSLRSVLNESASSNMSLEEINSIATSTTKDLLNFTSEKCDLNSNKLVNSSSTNCIGYSNMYNSIANYLIVRSKQEDRYKAIHHKGQLYMFGENIHNYFNSAFFKDHDFNELKNMETGNNLLVDPSLSDYLLINKVELKEKVEVEKD